MLVILWRHPHSSTHSPDKADYCVIPRIRQGAQDLEWPRDCSIMSSSHRPEAEGLLAQASSGEGYCSWASGQPGEKCRGQRTAGEVAEEKTGPVHCLWLHRTVCPTVSKVDWGWVQRREDFSDMFMGVHTYQTTALVHDYPHKKAVMRTPGIWCFLTQQDPPSLLQRGTGYDLITCCISIAHHAFQWVFVCFLKWPPSLPLQWVSDNPWFFR